MSVTPSLPSIDGLAASPQGPSDPGLRALRAHLAEPKFRSGEHRGWWRVHCVDWPVLEAAVCTDHGELGLRLDLTGYPTQAPTAQPWDLAA